MEKSTKVDSSTARTTGKESKSLFDERLTFTDGRMVEGEWKDGLQDGPGTFYYPTGKRVKGTWVQGKFDKSTKVVEGE